MFQFPCFLKPLGGAQLISAGASHQPLVRTQISTVINASFIQNSNRISVSSGYGLDYKKDYSKQEKRNPVDTVDTIGRPHAMTLLSFHITYGI